MKSANGSEGYLIGVGDKIMFRVYDENFSFVDYDINHNDLVVTITDSDAYFYNGTVPYIDYSPQTLGYPQNETTF